MKKLLRWTLIFVLVLGTGEHLHYLTGPVSEYLGLENHFVIKTTIVVLVALGLLADIVTQFVSRDSFPDEERKNRLLRRVLRSMFIRVVAIFGGRKWYETYFVLGEKKQASFLWHKSTTVRIDNLATFIARGEQIRTYFADCPNEKQLRVNIEIDEGYLVDHFLLWGIMDDFKAEWQPIVAEYNFHMHQTEGVLSSFESFRRSQFICWLLWGPSIPACDCELWQCTHQQTGDYPARIAWQFGFGDENNSVFLCLTRKQIQRIAGAPGQVHLVAESQFMVMNPDSEEIEKSVNALAAGPNIRKQAKRLYLFSAKGKDIHLDDSRGFYYTAYLWVMFVCVLLPEDGQTEITFCTSEGIRNRSESLSHESMLPFFVHANIYDRNQLPDYEEMLVSQTLSAFHEVVCRERDGKLTMPREDVIFVYAGASDDPRHGDNSNARIRKLLEEKLKNPLHRDLISRVKTIDGLIKSTGINANRHIRTNLDHVLTPCNFPDYFQSYYENVKSLRELTLAT